MSVVDTLPPGELPENEISASAFFNAMHSLLSLASEPADAHLKLKPIEKVGPVYMATVEFTDRQGPQEVTFRVRRERLIALHELIGKAIGK